MSKKIIVVGLGQRDASHLTLTAEAQLRAAECLVLRTARHPVAEWLNAEGLPYESLDDYYGRFDDFDAMHTAMANDLWRKAARRTVTFAVSDPSADQAVRCLRQLKPAGAALQIVPGLSALDEADARLGGLLDASAGLCVIPASALSPTALMGGMPALITEIDNPHLAGDVKLTLCDAIGDETAVFLLPSLLATSGRPKEIQACELDRQKHYDHTVSVYIPALSLQERSRYGFAELLRLVEVLRGEDGCPWDRKQTHESMRTCLVEEAYEAAGAIDEEDDAHLFDELGDVLFQVVFHASIGQQQASFDIQDVCTAICRKMIARHPHVFPPVDGQDAAAETWEERKRREKGLTTQASVLSDVSRALPALTRADKVQKKAAQVGFDWPNAEEALPKVAEEAEEVRSELPEGAHLAEELGDLLFSCVNVIRLAGCDPEQVLTHATDKFVSRFTEMENLIKSDGKSLKALTLQEMDVYWNAVKSRRNSGG
ncbi:MAG: nucleoside triphosphate pyrophosphohydrolase [Clostridia bacterium]|nr:nucleoside triphosphate pyrophosphohydrolase [Clostridia bacterium]